VHLRPILLYKGLDPKNGVVPGSKINPSGTIKAFHTSVPMGSALTGRTTHLDNAESSRQLSI
jgi:hypothetical protein